jgi:hypothetical protein
MGAYSLDSLFLFSLPFFSFFLSVGSCYVAWGGLELVILLPLPTNCWDYRHIPPCPAFIQLLRKLDQVHFGVHMNNIAVNVPAVSFGYAQTLFTGAMLRRGVGLLFHQE